MSLAWGGRPVTDNIRGLESIWCNVTIVRVASRPAHDLGWVLIIGVDIWEEVAVVHTVNNYVSNMAMSCNGHGHGNDSAYQFHC